MQIVVQKSRGYQYVSIRESYWDKARKKYTSRTVKNFGRLDVLQKDNPNILEELRQQVQELNQRKESDKEALIKKRLVEATEQAALGQNLNGDNRSVMIGAAPLRQIWNSLQLNRKLRDIQSKGRTKYNLSEVIFYLVAARSLMPDSKLAQWERRNSFLYGSSRLRLNHLYRALDQLIAHKDELMPFLNRQIAKQYQRSVSIALYDVTTYWFESQDADTLRDFGFSKDNKVNQVQVVMGLLIDQNGIPIDYELFPGNTNEFGTMIPILKKLKEQYNIDKVIVTADRGLNSGANLQQIIDLGMEYVIAYRLRNGGQKILDLIKATNGWTYRNDTTLCNDVSKYRISTEDRNVTIIDEETGKRTRKTLTSNLLINFSAKRKRKDKRDRERLIEKAKKYAEKPTMLKSDLRRGGKSYLKIDSENMTAELDEERIKASEKFDGYYGISFSNPNRTAEEILAIHHSLWQIEESFRISKSLLRARPCFHWIERRVKAHFLICYLALVIHRLLEKTLSDAGVENLTAERIVDALSEAELIEVLMPEGQAVYAKVRSNGDFESICQAVGLGVLPRLSKASDVKRALKVKEL